MSSDVDDVDDDASQVRSTAAIRSWKRGWSLRGLGGIGPAGRYHVPSAKCQISLHGSNSSKLLTIMMKWIKMTYNHAIMIAWNLTFDYWNKLRLKVVLLLGTNMESRPFRLSNKRSTVFGHWHIGKGWDCGSLK